MALKGKKKPSRRGSQARRKPAAPPRPVYGGKERKRWYQTTSGLVIGFLIAATVLIVAIWWASSSRDDAQQLETTQQELNDYTSQLRGVTQSLDETVSALSGASEMGAKKLEREAKKWKEDINAAQTSLGQATTPAGSEAVTPLLLQALQLYVQTIEQHELRADFDGKVAKRISGQAAGSFAAANSIYVAGLQLLDDARTEAELDASGLTAPGAGGGQQPVTTTTEGGGETP